MSLTDKNRAIIITERWKDGAPSCLYIWAFDGYEAYTGEVPRPADPKDRPELGLQDDVSNFDELARQLRRVPSRDIYPAFTEGLTRFEPGNGGTSGVHLKGPSMNNYHSGDDGLARTLLDEARINETLLSNPHPNLGTYLGCVVHDGLIVRLAFKRYSGSLIDRVWQRPPIPFPAEQRRDCIDGVKGAAAHLHGLGLAHNDISPGNVMFDENGSAVLIDLDCCVRLGGPLVKGGLVNGWRGPLFGSGPQFETSSVECDELAVQGLQDWMEEEVILAET